MVHQPKRFGLRRPRGAAGSRQALRQALLPWENAPGPRVCSSDQRAQNAFCRCRPELRDPDLHPLWLHTQGSGMCCAGGEGPDQPGPQSCEPGRCRTVNTGDILGGMLWLPIRRNLGVLLALKKLPVVDLQFTLKQTCAFYPAALVSLTGVTVSAYPCVCVVAESRDKDLK